MPNGGGEFEIKERERERERELREQEVPRMRVLERMRKRRIAKENQRLRGIC